MNRFTFIFILFVLIAGCTKVVYKTLPAEKLTYIEYDIPPVPIDGFPTSLKDVRYPIRAQRYGIEGVVVILAYINEQGFAAEVTVLKGIPSFGLNETAVEAIRKTRFRPARYQNKTVGAWVNIPVKFRLPLEPKITPTYNEEEVIFESPTSVYHERYTPEERMAFKSVLSYLGYELDTESPKWDKLTDKALREFQQGHNLSPDGKIGPITMFTMENALREEAVISISRQDFVTLPLYSEFWKKYVKGKDIKEGDLLKYYDYKTGKFKYAEIEYKTGSEVEAANYEIEEYLIDIYNDMESE